MRKSSISELCGCLKFVITRLPLKIFSAMRPALGWRSHSPGSPQPKGQTVAYHTVALQPAGTVASVITGGSALRQHPSPLLRLLAWVFLRGLA